MKMSKALVVALMAVMLVSVFAGSAAAAAPTVNVGDLIKDQAGWEGDSITFDGGKATFEAKDGPRGYTAKKFEDAIFDMKITFDLADSWPGIQLRADQPTKAIWEGGSGYLIIFKADVIEVQRWEEGKETRLKDIPNEGKYKTGTAYNVQLGTVNEEGGVRVTIKIDGNEVLNHLDAGGVKGEGAFGVYSYKTATVLEGVAAAAAPADSGDAGTLPKTGSNVPVGYLYVMAAALVAAGVIFQLRKRNAVK